MQIKREGYRLTIRREVGQILTWTTSDARDAGGFPKGNAPDRLRTASLERLEAGPNGGRGGAGPSGGLGGHFWPPWSPRTPMADSPAPDYVALRWRSRRALDGSSSPSAIEIVQNIGIAI
jgi:hypothetical protein